MTTAQATGYSAISSYSRVELMHLLQQRPQRTIAELTEATGLHANTVREHLQRLIDEGYVVAVTERRTTRGRPRVLYSAADGTAASSPVQRRRVRAAAERGDLMRRVMPASTPITLDTEALHQLDAIVDDLVDSGFDPIVDEDDLSLELTPCHQAQAQAEHLEVLCQVHLSIMQGVLTEAGGPLRVEGIRPSCDPTECVVLLSHAGRPAQ
ncbi:ArsR family transcriptional regulator [Microbacterium invictum]|uniref:ArsR family transcriptional regulator n=1 Tax=Microbacterium invictum TaxID=515415 RepID=A0AA40SLE4_9MICO|nr:MULTISPECIES: ArsR family transcriptional regulator [Microbacterium]MBB4138383.1 putative ArsR family transcriptional regulator [Microbacterium invictum]